MRVVTALMSALLLLFSGVARSDVVVLVHGYLSSAAAWDWSGVTHTLEAHGWQRGGVTGEKQFYSVELPAEAPLLLQADHLQRQLTAIRQRHPTEPLSVVGHSAGGVIARLLLVRGNSAQINTLITIATPHLGTLRAGDALDVANIPFPFSLLPSFFAGDEYHALRRSRLLLSELLPAAPGTLLGWLNQQPHPDIRYVSVVRGTPYAMSGDALVPGFSQDMNNVPLLRGRSERVVIPSPHELTPSDGLLLLNLL